MTAHELGRLLLAGPDGPTTVEAYGESLGVSHVHVYQWYDEATVCIVAEDEDGS
jgi:hypothetical protein